MIKFFRKIRYDVMEKNKTGKPAFAAGRYLKYAIGEILLVVIGILIALQINNWNEERKRAFSEAQALKELLEEFETNYTDLMRIERIKKRGEDRIRKHLSFINNDSIPKSEKNRIVTNLASNTWNETYTVLNGLISSGAIKSLKNDSLRTLLNKWNGIRENYIELQEIYTKDHEANYRLYLEDKYPRDVIQKDSTYRNWNSYSFETNVEIRDYASKIVDDIVYQNKLKEALFYLYIQLNGIQSLKEQHHDIVRLLQIEISSSDD